MQNRIIKSISDSLFDTSNSFLENDMSIGILEDDNYLSDNGTNYLSAVNFRGSLDLTCAISIDDKLLLSIFKSFFPYKLNPNETKEMIDELPKEIINIIAGLSISKFPAAYQDLEMSIPFKIDNKTLKTLLSKHLFATNRIKTSDGFFTCTVVKIS